MNNKTLVLRRRVGGCGPRILMILMNIGRGFKNYLKLQVFMT